MPRSCRECGADLPFPDVELCNKCAGRIPETAPVESTLADMESAEQKKPGVAVLCSAFIPGLGQVYNGETAKGVAIFLGIIAGLLLMVLPAVLIWLFCIYDAYSIAGKMNSGKIRFRPVRTAHLILFGVLVLLVLIITIFLAYVWVIASVLAVVTRQIG
jgi:TM2 domain-containing membrane protein YozV